MDFFHLGELLNSKVLRFSFDLFVGFFRWGRERQRAGGEKITGLLLVNDPFGPTRTFCHLHLHRQRWFNRQLELLVASHLHVYRLKC